MNIIDENTDGEERLADYRTLASFIKRSESLNRIEISRVISAAGEEVTNLEAHITPFLDHQGAVCFNCFFFDGDMAGERLTIHLVNSYQWSLKNEH